MYENKHPYGNMAILVGATETGMGISQAEPAPHITPASVPTERGDFYRAPLRGIPLPERVGPTMMDSKTVRELMHYGAITVSASTSVDEVARRMSRYRIHAIVVIDDAGFAIGLISQTDVVLARQGRSLEELAHAHRRRCDDAQADHLCAWRQHFSCRDLDDAQPHSSPDRRR